MSRLLLVRHGDTESNSRERYWGRTDVKLSAAGLCQAEKLRDRLATQKIDAVYASDLQRASTAAEIIASRHQLDVITCAEIRETNFGRVEGLTADEVNHLYPDLAKSWAKWSLQLEFPDGENVGEVIKRVGSFVDRLKKHTVEETIFILAHSAPLRLIICQLLGIGMKHWRQFYLDLASLSIVETYPEIAIIRRLNDISHLGEKV